MINHSNGYGFGQDTDGVAKITKCLRAIPEDLLVDFIYTMYRMADKTQTEGFEVIYEAV